ncbi:membrane protein insertion efficiency factor YidD [Calderihabitans maritimus]|uniref:membrane protein insertion efficiency factor YidD n=1 Tax=Calderihabitans maritimus TaxID=1246530 RepID=UPI000B50BE86|nr:membrane protein insertion efficiency factor YidD [Calderihabitans maritimus]
MLARLLIIIIKIYQKTISCFLPSRCRFYPSCSQYAIIALHKFGFWKGIYLSVKRILRCHPFNPGGYDPI